MRPFFENCFWFNLNFYRYFMVWLEIWLWNILAITCATDLKFGNHLRWSIYRPFLRFFCSTWTYWKFWDTNVFFLCISSMVSKPASQDSQGGCIYYVVRAFKNDITRCKKKVCPNWEQQKNALPPPPEATKKCHAPSLATGESSANFVIWNALKW